MAITTDIPKHQPKLRQQAWVIIGISFLYGLAMAAVLFVSAAFAHTLDRWPGYIGLSLGMFVLFTGGAFETYASFYANHAWGKYTIDDDGVTVARLSKEATYLWEKFSSYSLVPFTYAKLSRDPGSNVKLYPKSVRIPRNVGMHLLLLYWNESVKTQLALPLEVPVREQDLGQVKDWVRARLVENTSIPARWQKFLAKDEEKFGP